MKVPTNVLHFAGEKNLAPYSMFYDYYNQYRAGNGAKVEFSKTDDKGNPISFEEKEALMNAALKREILRVSSIQNFAEFPLEAWVTNPMLSWATFAVVSAMIDMILPESIIDTIGAYAEVRTIGWGDTAVFDVEPRDLFVVSKAGHGQRSTEVHKQFRGTISITPVMHELTVAVSLYKVLAGQESLATFVSKVVRSLETELSTNVYDAFASAAAALPTTATTGLQVAGYSQAALVRLCQQVTAWNQGAKAVIMGTQLALVNVLPDDGNYRYFLEDDYMKLGFVKSAFGFDVIALPQVADLVTPFGLRLANERLWILSPSSQKLIKVVLEGSTLSNTDSTFANANMLQKSSMYKSWGAGVATNSVAGVLTI